MWYEFAGFRFDPERGLERGTRQVHLARKEHDLLAALLAAGGKILSKEEIGRRVWDGAAVSDDSIFRAIYVLRQVLAREGDGVDPIATAHGRGFRVAVPVASPGTPAASAHANLVRSSVPAAVESLVLALEYRGRRSPEDMAIAIEAARRAIRIDPGYVQAWTTLAELHVIEGTRWHEPPRTAFGSAAEAAAHALELDPAAPAALASAGLATLLLRHDFTHALELLDRAITIDPSFVTGLTFRGFALGALGRMDLAERDLRAAIEVNPMAPTTHVGLVALLAIEGRFAEAMEEMRAFAVNSPTMDGNLNIWALVAAFGGIGDEAIAAGRRAMETSPHTSLMHLGFLHALLATGRRDDAREVVAKLRAAEIPAPPSLLAPALLQLGDRDGAIEMIALGRDARCLQYLYSDLDPRLAELAADPSLDHLWSGLRAARRTCLESRAA